MIFYYLDGKIIYPNCPICQKGLYPQMLRCIFEQSKINELELRYRESNQIREHLCAECKLIIAEGEIDKDYYIVSECNNKFHADCIIGLYAKAPSIKKCPAANCEHMLTKQEKKKIKKRIPKFNKNEKALTKAQKKEEKKRQKAQGANKSSKVAPETYTADNRPQSTGMGIDKGNRNETYKEPQTAPSQFPIHHDVLFKKPIGRWKSGDSELEEKLTKAASSHEGMPSIADEGNTQPPNMGKINQSVGVNKHHLARGKPIPSQAITTTCCATKFVAITYRKLILSNWTLDRMYTLTEGNLSYLI